MSQFTFTKDFARLHPLQPNNNWIFSSYRQGALDTLDRQNLTQEWQKLVVLLLVEVYIREEVVYNKHTGQILGLSDVGNVNNHLLRYNCFTISQCLLMDKYKYFLFVPTDYKVCYR